MKKLILISILLVIVMSMTSCLTMLSVLLGDEDTTVSTQTDAENQTNTVATDNATKSRKEKDAYDTSKKIDCIAAGAIFHVPDYFSLGDNSKENSRWYYAETSGKVASINTFEWPGDGDGKKYSQAEFEEDISNNTLQNMFMKMYFSNENFSDAEILNVEYLNIRQKKCCLFSYQVKYKHSDITYKTTGNVFFIYVDRTDIILCLILFQTDNTEYTYYNDFRKVINSIKLLSEEEESASHAHDYITSVTKVPTCVEAGEKTMTCSICSKQYTETIPATGVHTYEVKVVKEATCIDDGENIYTCSVCSDSYKETVPATGNHQFVSKITKEPTCKDAGAKEHVCSVCGYKKTEEISKTTNHTYTEWQETKAASTSSAGIKERTCKICGQKQTEEIPKLYPVTLPKSTLANNGTNINKQQTVTISNYCEFTIENIDITNDVVPPKKSGVYSHYQAYDGKTYVDIRIKYKNTQSKKISADDVFRAYLIFSDIYEYRGFNIVEDDGGSDFTYSSITNIAPLSTIYLHVLFETSSLIKTTNGSLKAVFQINGKTYVVNIRDGSAEPMDTSEGYKQKSSGSIEKGEKIAIPGKCEFYIDSIDITSAVRPPRATGYYLYYKADEGNKYIDICFCFKNTGNQNLSADNAIKSAKFTYKSKYEYSASGCIEEKGRSEFTYLLITDIKPLCYEYIHVMFEVPDEVANNASGIPVSFVINGAKYSVTIK